MGLESYLLRGPAPAFLVALAVLLAGRRGAAAAALAVALGCAVAQGLSFGWPDLPGLGHFPDPQTEQRMVIGFAVLGPLGLVAARRGALGASACLLACLSLPTWLLWNIVKRMEVQAAVREMTPLGLVLLVAWGAATLAARRRPGPGVPMGLLLAAALGAGALLWGASLTLAKEGGLLCGALAACALLALARRDARLSEGAAGPAGAMLALLAVWGWRLADLPGPAAVLLALAPAGALLGLLASGRRATILAAAGPALLAGGAQAAAFLLRPEDPYAGY